MAEARILWQGDGFVLADKPGGWLSVPSRFEDKDERPVLGRWLENELGRRVFPLHRLDLEVSGLILFALTADSQRAGTEWFEKRWIHKIYEGRSVERDFSHWPANLPASRAEMDLVEGARFEWTCKIQRGKRRSFVSDHGDPSRTVAIFKGRRDGFLHWSLEPVTGRSHQLRLEMSRHGFPLVGDELYGSRETYRPGEIALRSVFLDLSQVQESKRAGLPAEFRTEGLK